MYSENVFTNSNAEKKANTATVNKGKNQLPFFQPKLTINQPNDVYEQEADAMADKVMRMEQPFIQAKPVPLTPIQRKCAECEKEEKAQRKEINGEETEAGEGLESYVGSLNGGGTPLSNEAKNFYEPRFGTDFSNVRIHTDTFAAKSAQSINALAYTSGNNIVFNSGQYSPNTDNGKRLLGHELTHVVQQGGGAKTKSIQRKFVATGATADFANMINSILAVQVEIVISPTGEISIRNTGIQGPPTRDATELLNTLRTVINDRNTTTIEFIHGSTSRRPQDINVIVGNYAQSSVDLDDVAAFGSTSSHSRQGDNSAVQFIHEITEQYRKQAFGEGFQTAHRAGYAAQERLLGATLVRETPMTPVAGTTQGEVTTTYRYPDRREVDVITRMDFSTGQIVSVRRVIR